MDDGEALLAAILDCPADDNVRLVYADYLDENGEPARAEFVRVQVELARGPDGIDCERIDGDGDRYDCRPLAKALPKIGRVVSVRCRSGSTWTVLTGRVCAWIETAAGERFGFSLTGATGREWKPELRRREEELLHDHEWGWLHAVCPELHRGSYSDRKTHWLYPHSWSRGFLDSFSLPAEDFLECAGAVFRAHPVTDVRLTDRRPIKREGGPWVWRCATDGESVAEVVRFGDNMLPWDLYWSMPGSLGPYFAECATLDDATKSLSEGCVAFGRAKARLPLAAPAE